MSEVVYNRKKVFAWMLYDWANSAFATVVLVGFFPIFFKQVLAADLKSTVSSFYLGLANSLTGLAIILLAPFLGVVADQTNGHKRFLLIFALIGILATAGLSFLGPGDWLPGLSLFTLAAVGFMGSVVFYDAMLLAVAPLPLYERVSAGGFALGYLGGGLIFAFCVLMTLYPDWFALDGADRAVRLSFVLTGVWWAAFSLPLLRIPQPRTAAGGRNGGHRVKSALTQLWGTFIHIRSRPEVFKFLLAYWLYIDGVGTIIRMATDYGLSVGIGSNDLIVALLITQFVGFPATLVYGRLAEKIGARNGVMLALSIYLVISINAYFMDSAVDFYILAAAVGLVQGGVQALSRSIYAALIPVERSAEFFGFYNMMGKMAVLLGPVLMGMISALTGNSRYSVFAVVVLIGLGMWVLTTVRPARKQKHESVRQV